MITPKKLKSFVKWLSEHGAEILDPTNEWEIVRFRGNAGTSIVYQRKGGTNSFTNEAAKAWESFCGSQPWRAVPRSRRVNLSPVVKTLLKRDGPRCFFCGGLMELGEESIDHLVPKTHGGPDHVSNFVLMHSPCNQMCGDWPATHKIRAHVEWRRVSDLMVIKQGRCDG